MSKRAEEFALKEFPEVYSATIIYPQRVSSVRDTYVRERAACRHGYEQAEKDLALTWEDIRELDEWISAVQTSDNLSGEELYKEVLKRFNEYKEERK